MLALAPAAAFTNWVTRATRPIRKPGAMIGADKGYDTAKFVDLLKQRRLKAHIARVWL
jgi:hypothetical protein